MKRRIDRWLEGLETTGRPDEFEAKKLLKSIGIPVPEGIRLLPGQALKRPGFAGPFAVKTCSPDIVHKTDRQGLRLHVEADRLVDAVDEMRRRFPKSGVLIEQMVNFGPPELIIGGLVDPVFGPTVMVGAGGILTELYRDVTFRLAPFHEREARRMLRDLTLHPLFEGFRGIDVDTPGLARTLGIASQLLAHLKDRLDHLDINPIVFADGRWTALDAKLKLVPGQEIAVGG
ncbi:MAG: acetate--CoA ligase family protein [Desulfobacterales bacterium]